MAVSDVSRDEVADRISAYVYGNILTLAALVVLHAEEVENGVAVAIVAGTALSTFIAHVYAESLGSAARGDDHPGWRTVLRDSRPILSAAVVPVLLMLAGSLEWFRPAVCLRAAEAYIVVRLALTGFMVGRLRGLPVTIRTWVASIALAAVAMLVVSVKVALTH